MFEISLGIIKNSNPPSTVPFWFTRKNEHHLSQQTVKSKEIDIKTESTEVLIQIINAVKTGHLKVTSLQELLDEYNSRTEIAKVEEVVETEYKAPASAEELDAKKDAELFEKAKALAELSVNKLKKEVGPTALNENGSLAKGIIDQKLLQMIVAVEESKETPRTSVISLCHARLEAISTSNGFMEEEDVETVLTMEDLKG